MANKKYLVLDFNTTDFLKYKILNKVTLPKYPYIVEVGWRLIDGDDCSGGDFLVRLPDGVTASDGATNYHGISAYDIVLGVGRDSAFDMIRELIEKSDCLVFHNAEFDLRVLEAEFMREGLDWSMVEDKSVLCTMKIGTDLCKIPSAHKVDDYKYPSLEVLYSYLLNASVAKHVRAGQCAELTAQCFKEILKLGSAT